MIDTLIVGGSVAGLSAALLLGRCRRTVLVCDAGRPRNRHSGHMHAFLSREGIPPAEFLEIARAQVREFDTVALRQGEVERLEAIDGGFRAVMNGEEACSARTVLLATGVVDELPALPGIEAFYGRSVHHCPYCDGWEHRDQRIAVHGAGEAGRELAEEMLTWSRRVFYCADGGEVSAGERERLIRLGVRVIDARVAGLEGRDGRLGAVRFADGSREACGALFFSAPQRRTGDLARQLGCAVEEEPFVACEQDVRTCVPGVYVAGNRSAGLQLAIVATAEGAKAAHAIHNDLMERSLSARLEAGETPPRV